MTTDDLKLARDGHLAFGRRSRSDRPLLRRLHTVVLVTATSVFTTLGDGFGVVEWRRP